MADEPYYRDPDWLEARYWDDELTQQEIADECDLNVRTIRKWMNRHDIETRKPEGKYHGLYGEERDEETREKISERLKGRTFSEVTRERMSAAKQGKAKPESVREKISEALAGRPKSLETRRKMAAARGCEWHGDQPHAVRYGAGWTAAREAALETQACCQHCAHDGGEYDLDVHHLIPVRHFIDHDNLQARDAHFQANLVVLCRPCHVKAEHGMIEEFAPLNDVPPSELETFIKDHRNPPNASLRR